jgi:hypothetical protein
MKGVISADEMIKLVNDAHAALSPDIVEMLAEQYQAELNSFMVIIAAAAARHNIERFDRLCSWLFIWAYGQGLQAGKAENILKDVNMDNPLTITITVEGGVVTEVEGLPPGCLYKVIDLDSQEE